MLTFIQFSEIFSFNDTATTEIYTLSLHDALPISSSCPNPLPRSCARTRPISSGHDAPRRPDRKSTRLNSSHDQNSYAVFCLKKKMDDAAGGLNRRLSPVAPGVHLDHVGRGERPGLVAAFFFKVAATTGISPLSLHAALPI